MLLLGKVGDAGLVVEEAEGTDGEMALLPEGVMPASAEVLESGDGVSIEVLPLLDRKVGVPC